MPAIPPEALLLAPVVILAYATQAFTGFGGALVALTLGANFIPVAELVPILVAPSVAVTGTLAIRHRRDVDWRILISQIFPFMGAGIVAGLVAWEVLRGLTPAWILGVIVVVFAARQLWLVARGREGAAGLNRLQAGILQFLAGVTHAFYTAGGPFLIYTVSRMNLPKRVFRATLCVVWAVFNSALCVVFLANGRIDSRSLSMTVPILLALPVGVAAGEFLHDRVNEHTFRVLTYTLLLLSGIPLMFK
ncbi:MAG: sulfite exporter TauE/SafE family protein [Desulfatibacillaceae bacterium]